MSLWFSWTRLQQKTGTQLCVVITLLVIRAVCVTPQRLDYNCHMIMNSNVAFVAMIGTSISRAGHPVWFKSWRLSILTVEFPVLPQMFQASYTAYRKLGHCNIAHVNCSISFRVICWRSYFCFNVLLLFYVGQGAMNLHKCQFNSCQSQLNPSVYRCFTWDKGRWICTSVNSAAVNHN
jgi:hypothetical protein